ncbi:unnamed protein product [Strongylus vulgaris]|uniref:Uncharacterized protein n=1 Tax=Strongylus vulgaris TaxID=40348 RepID=A0A3P7JVF8_STRVU|nr:unnamed protein product [Strongylus vulgaris]
MVLFFYILTPIATLACAIRWLVYFYWTIDFDHLMEIHWITNDIVSLIANILQLLFFIGVFAFTWYLTDDRLDAHHKAHARGDIAILFGCCFVLFVKLVGVMLLKNIVCMVTYELMVTLPDPAIN